MSIDSTVDFFHTLGFSAMLVVWLDFLPLTTCIFQESHGRTKSELHRTEEMLSSSLSGVASLEQSLSNASEKYLYMQELRNYFAILCDFLQVTVICPFDQFFYYISHNRLVIKDSV